MALALRELPSVPSMSERQLVRAVRRGEDRAFEQLFARYRRRISAYVYGLVGDHGRAEDITQEVFISALRRLRETERPVAFRPWIYEIARNACIDEFRRTQRAHLVSLDENRGERGAQVPLLPDDSSPEGRFERKQQLGDLFGAFSSLSDSHHRILVMRELEGLSYGEIGQQLGMSRPVVESTLFRARRRLSEEYAELASGRRCRDVRTAVDEQERRALTSLGIRQRRRIAGHLAHCTDCLRYARLAGVDATALAPSPARRVAALLPFGWLRWLVGRGGSRLGGAAHRASGLGEAGPPAVAAGRAASAAVALLIAGTALPGLGGQPVQHVPRHGAPAAPSATPAHARTGQASGHRAAGLLLPPARGSAQTHHARGRSARLAAGGSGAQWGGGSGHGGGAVSAGGPGGTAGGPASTSPAAGAGSSSGPSAAGTGGSGGSGTLGAAGQIVHGGGNVLGQLTGAGGATGTVTTLVNQSTQAVGSTLAQTGSALAQTGSAVGSVVSQTGSTVGHVLSQTGAAVQSTSAPATSAVTAPVAKTLDTAGNLVTRTGQTAGAVTSTVTSLPSRLLSGRH
jgi:RNA polymerase sigma factor (sigma-70 family)